MLNTEQFAKLYAETAAENGADLKNKEARAQVDIFLDTVVKAAKHHGGVDFARYFGIPVKETKARTVKNPRFHKDPTVDEYVNVAAGKKAGFKKNKFLKELN